MSVQNHYSLGSKPRLHAAWWEDYRLDAKLDLMQFTAIIINVHYTTITIIGLAITTR